MSKASIAQEPSMDEILASIRRIIETGEDKNGAPVARSPFRDAPLRPFPAVVSPPEPEAQPTFEPQAAEQAERQDAEPAVAARSGSMLADDDHLTAQLENELAATWSEFGAAHGPEREEPAAAYEPEHAGEQQLEASMTTGSQGGWSPFAASADAPEGARIEDGANTASAQAPGADEAAGEEVASTFRPANTDRPVTLPLDHAPTDRSYDHRGGDALLSERSGTLVASSFEELAQAIRNGELRSIEAMAQDMLRPMLREWLDDNLPHMVERLVREEIERMARGGRR